MTSIVVVSEDLSLRAVISGLDIVRIFYDLPAKIPEETPAEKAYRLKKEQKKAKRERDKAAIAAIREKKKNQNFVSEGIHRNFVRPKWIQSAWIVFSSNSDPY